MKPLIAKDLTNFSATIIRSRKYPIYLFLALCLNVILASKVFAAGETFSRNQAYALSLLGLVTVALAIYLFVVMFQPERF
jgi:K+-transporting ATPase KdpF subunit